MSGIKEEVEGIWSETRKISIDMDSSVVMPRLIFSSRASLTVDELKCGELTKQFTERYLIA